MRTTSRARVAAAVAGALCWLAAAPALAAAAPPAEAPEVEDARDAYRLGSLLVKQGQWSDALAAFERSARLKPDAVTAFNLGYCERALGRFTRARKRFQAAVEAPELPADKASEARGYLAEIESRLSRAVITLDPASATVAVDGRPLEAGEPGRTERVAGTREPGPPEVVGVVSFTLVLDPGAHVIVVGAPGLPDAVVTRTLAPGATVILALAPGAATVVADTGPRGDPPGAARSPRRLGAILAFSAGSVASVVGAVSGALVLADKHTLAGVCPTRDQCASSAQGTIAALRTFSAVSTAGLVTAAAAAGVGAVLLLGDGRSGPAPTALTLSIGPAHAGLGASF